MFTVNQRVAALAATMVEREQLAKEAKVSYPTLVRFARGQDVLASSEQKIIAVIRSHGWEMRDGGVLPVEVS